MQYSSLRMLKAKILLIAVKENLEVSLHFLQFKKKSLKDNFLSFSNSEKLQFSFNQDAMVLIYFTYELWKEFDNTPQKTKQLIL